MKSRNAIIKVIGVEIIMLIMALAILTAAVPSTLSAAYLSDKSSEEELPGPVPDEEGSTIRSNEEPVVRVLGTISESTGTRTDIGAAYDPYKPVAQSMAYTGDGFAVSFTDGPESDVEGVLKFFDAGGLESGIQKTAPLYHANGMCVTKEGTILVTRQDVDTDLEFDTGNGLSESEKYLPYSAAAIAYDRDSDKYILRTGPTVVVFSGAINSETKEYSYKPGAHEDYYQDIGAGNGFFYSCHSINKDGDNYIDVFSEATGDYCGSYKVDYGELESCDIVNGELEILVHIAGSASNYLQFTGIKAVRDS